MLETQGGYFILYEDLWRMVDIVDECAVCFFGNVDYGIYFVFGVFVWLVFCLICLEALYVNADEVVVVLFDVLFLGLSSCVLGAASR